MEIDMTVLSPAFAIVSPKAMKNGSTKNGVTAYVGTGPYKLTKVVTDEYAVFEANENYWGEQPKIKRVVVKVIPDNQTRILALEKGEIDLIWNGTEYGISYARSRGQIAAYVWNRPETTQFFRTAADVLEYRLGADRLRDVITQVTVLDRTI